MNEKTECSYVCGDCFHYAKKEQRYNLESKQDMAPCRRYPPVVSSIPIPQQGGVSLMQVAAVPQVSATQPGCGEFVPMMDALFPERVSV